MSNQPNQHIDTNGIHELAEKLENNLTQATQVITDSLNHSRHLMAQIHHAHQVNEANIANQSAAQSSPNNEQHASASKSASTASPITSVEEAVKNLAKHEQGAFQHMQQHAQQQFQQAEQILENTFSHQGKHPSQQPGIGGFAESVGASLHQGVDQGEALIEKMRLDAAKHIQDAEKSIQESLSKIHHAIEDQGKVFAQSKATQAPPTQANEPSNTPSNVQPKE